jgi:hypothetical protein
LILESKPINPIGIRNNTKNEYGFNFEVRHYQK